MAVIGGAYITVGGSNGRPIAYRPLPPGTPQWGSDWKRAVAKWYHSALDDQRLGLGDAEPRSTISISIRPTPTASASR